MTDQNKQEQKKPQPQGENKPKGKELTDKELEKASGGVKDSHDRYA